MIPALVISESVFDVMCTRVDMLPTAFRAAVYILCTIHHPLLQQPHNPLSFTGACMREIQRYASFISTVGGEDKVDHL